MKFFAFILLAAASASVSAAKPRDEKPYPPMKRELTRAIIVTNHVHIPTLWKFNPVFWFENYDRPDPPRGMWRGDPLRQLKWNLRNPFHNFDFYIIGIADKTFVREGKYPERVFAPEEGWNRAVCKYKWMRLPFVSYWRGPFRFYIGWRNRGQFGFEFKFSKPKEQPAARP
jgi:hypothetical protein